MGKLCEPVSVQQIKYQAEILGDSESPPPPSANNTHTLLGRTGCNTQILEVAVLKYRYLNTSGICLPHLSLPTIKARASLKTSRPA